jgi:hypothetical protein
MLTQASRDTGRDTGRDTDVITRAVAAPALAALAVIHVVDLPATLGPAPLIGIGYLVIIAAAVGSGGLMLARSHWLAWACAGGLAAAAMGGYLLTRALPGGFLGDQADIGNWRCPLGLAALSVEALIIGLAAAWTLWRGRFRPRRLARSHPARPHLTLVTPTCDSGRPQLRSVPSASPEDR